MLTPRGPHHGGQALDRDGVLIPLEGSLQAETAGDLLLRLVQAQVALGLIVAEGDGQVAEEGEHSISAEPEAFEQVAGKRLLDAAAPARPAIRRGIGRETRCQERLVLGDQGVLCGRRKSRQVAGPHLVGDCFHLQEQPLEVFGRALLILLVEEGQLAQMMDVARCMAAGGVRPLDRPAVMGTDAAIVGQDASGVGSRAAAPRLERIVGQPLGAGDRRPGEPAAPTAAPACPARGGHRRDR